MKTLLLGVTGAIGAASLPQHFFGLRQVVASEIFVILSRTAATLVSPYALSVLSSNKVFRELTDCTPEIAVPHIELPRKADLFAIMPATAHVIARCAHGICDDLITTAVVATPEDVPIVFVPSMNETMWNKRVVRDNVSRLRDLGHHVIEPVEGYEVVGMKPVSGAMPPIEEVCVRLLEIHRRHHSGQSESSVTQGQT